jgi:hypothetical protein
VCLSNSFLSALWPKLRRNVIVIGPMILHPGSWLAFSGQRAAGLYIREYVFKYNGTECHVFGPCEAAELDN